YQVRELDILRVFRAPQIHEPADYLLARRAADLDVRVECRTKVLREWDGYIVTAKVDPKCRNSESFQQSTAGSRNSTAADGAFDGIDRRLVRSEPQRRLQI